MTAKDTKLHCKIHPKGSVSNSESSSVSGGLDTISPPAKVKSVVPKPLQVLASGIDSLYLAIDVFWKDDSFFQYLITMKELARESGGEAPFTFKNDTDEVLWRCKIKKFGGGGYEWLLHGSDFSLSIGNWLSPGAKPSIKVQIHSAALWELTPINAVEFLIHLLIEAGACIKTAKVSRVDICTDIALTEKEWHKDLEDYFVCRARRTARYKSNKKIQGFSIGKSQISARLYDKPLEIKQQSNKTWMYDVWEINEVPEDLTIIRIEFQLRREAIKDFDIDSVSDLFKCPENLWGNCTQKWLKIQSNPGKHHTQRKTLPWWEIIQNSFLGVQKPTPLIRHKSIKAKRYQLLRQASGLMKSAEALRQEERGLPTSHDIPVKDAVSHFTKDLERINENEFLFGTEIYDKRAQLNRSNEKLLTVLKARWEHGFPDNLSIKEIVKKR